MFYFLLLLLLSVWSGACVNRGTPLSAVAYRKVFNTPKHKMGGVDTDTADLNIRVVVRFMTYQRANGCYATTHKGQILVFSLLLLHFTDMRLRNLPKNYLRFSRP
jgi:hypothetical protein